MTSRKLLIGLPLLAALIGGGAFLHLSRGPSGDPASAAVAAPVIPVTEVTVQRGDVPIYLQGIGTAQAYNTVTVRTQVQGQITAIDFKEGQAVNAGDLLAQIDSRPYQAQLDQMIANRDRDQASLADAQLILNRYTPLLASQYVSQQAFDSQKAQVAQLAATVKADEAAIENAQVQLSYTSISSPIAGITGIRLIDIGNIVHPTDATGLVVVTQLQPISVLFTLPETDLGAIQQAMAKGPLTTVAYAQDDTTLLDQGTLEVVSNEINQAAGTIQLKATFPNAARHLWPGELLSVHLLLETRHDGLTVPVPVVQRGPQGAYAYVITPANTAEERPITATPVGNTEMLVDSGLAAGEHVVLDGQSKLQQGSKVTVVQGQAAQHIAAESVPNAGIP